MDFKIIAKTFQGLEEVLAKEVTALGADNIEIGKRMVSFTGDQEMLYRANFCLRTAVRVLKPIAEFRADDADEVYEKVKQMAWEEYMDVSQTLLIDSVVFSDNFRHSKFVAYRVKDAIADHFRDLCDQRPNVSISNPDIRINVHIAEDRVTISLDSSGESLHKRGYRTGSVAAPINEVLAAAIVMMTGWKCDCDFIDPFCGSGTILIEAALIARNIYPGVFREEFGFERWKDFDQDLLEKIYNDDSAERDFDYKIYGFDINRQAVAIAQDNVRSAGVGKIVEVQQQDFYDFTWENERRAIMVTNPPYGERITTDDILDLYSTIGSRLKQQFQGNDAWIFSSHEECFDKIGFRPSTKIALFNGSLPCELRRYQVFSGRLSDRREEGLDIKTDEERRRNLHYKPHRRDDDAEFDGKSWRAEGSRDDEHYFRSRPDRPKAEWNRQRRDDRHGGRREGRRFGEGRNRDERPAFKPLFEGDEPFELNRRNFKWGDRSKRYRPEDERDLYFQNPLKKKERKEDRGERRPDFKKRNKKGDNEKS